MKFLYLSVTIFLIGKSQCYLSCQTFLTVSTNDFSYFYTNAVINWGPQCENPPKFIRIYDYNPYEYGESPLFELNTNGQKSGRVETNVKLNSLMLPMKWDVSKSLTESLATDHVQRKCLDYFIIGYNETNHPISFDCLKVEPRWMTEMTEIWNIPLKNLFIPGTHCSGCYMTRENFRDVKDEAFLQNFDVWHQLVLGVRSLDFSIGLHHRIDQLFYDPYDPFHEKVFWIQRGNILISPLIKIIRDVARFAQLSEETIILNFREFSQDFEKLPELHEVLKHVINEEVGSLALTRNDSNQNSYDVTINQMKSSKKYLIINYNHQNLSISHEKNETIFWPVWNDASVGDDFKTLDMTADAFLGRVFSEKFRDKDHDEGWMLSLDVDKFLNMKANDRTKAEIINSKALYALGGPWSLKTNLVSLDFAFSTNFVDIAIYTNRLKGASNGNLTVIDLS